MGRKRRVVKRDVALPPEWRCLEGKVSFVCQHSDTEYSASCPKCGGQQHPGGEYPDRCRLFVGEHPRLYCRRCGLIAFPDQFGDNTYSKPTPDEFEKWRQDRIAAEEARKRSAERALENLRSSRLWEVYHRQLATDGREFWRRSGIPDSLQNFWKLGWEDEYIFEYQDERYMSQTATIPIFGEKWQPINIKRRIIQVPEGAGKYRYELTGLPQPIYLTNPDLKIGGRVIVIEGEIKSMVVWLTLAERDTCVVGLPGCSPSAEILSQFGKADSVVLVLDPGAEEAARKLAQIIGAKKCKVLIPPVKIDDGILAVRPSKRELQNYLKAAVYVA